MKSGSVRIWQTALLLATLVGCVHRAPQYQIIGSTENLTQLKRLQAVPLKGKQRKSEDLHVEALREIALSVGAQSGLAFRSKQINQALTRESHALDRIFNFNLLLLAHHVLPPVLVQGENLLNLTDRETLRLADRSYRIESQARFVTTPPVWRDYLWMQYAPPEKPVAAFLPKTAEEQAIWWAAVTEGWENGLKQAETIYAENLARLKRDYQGMLLYRKLLKLKMVSRPFVAHTTLGITGDANELRIQDQILRITALPALQLQAKKWAPVIVRDKNN
jgi:defect-in-organelle-trafficking protein DotC